MFFTDLAAQPLEDEPRWPEAGGRRVALLVDASSPLEQRLVEAWAERARPEARDHSSEQWVSIPASRKRRPTEMDPRLEDAVAADDDPLLTPVRIAWLPELVAGERRARPLDLLKLGDPRDPGRLRQRWILARRRDRCRVVVAKPARASELRQRWRDAGGTDAANTGSLAEYVARQAALALERAERHLRGARYKVPRLVHEEILDRPAFRAGLGKLAREHQLELGGRGGVVEEAGRYLREIAATHSPFVIDLVSNLIRKIYTLGYNETLLYDRERLSGIAKLAQRHPVVFLPTHKSNLDHLVLQYMLHENGLPPNHTAGGINMNFFPVGPLVRRSGVFFIRRTFKDNPVYKHVLRSYIDYLIEKRFSLEWYIEGGRSRSGKLLPPRFGMLAYVVDAFRRGKSEDVYLIPISIGYDQIQDVGSYSAEARGTAKQAESFGWFVGFLRGLRRRYGDIHIRFGEPLSLRSQLGPPVPGAAPDPNEQSVELQKLAFEVSVRINRVTPITPASLLTLALLGAGDRAVTVPEARRSLRNIIDVVHDRKYPATVALEPLRTDTGIRTALDSLAENGVVSCYADGAEPVYLIGREQELTAAYYRNTVIHFFVNGAICELALLKAAEIPADDPLSDSLDDDPLERFWDEAMRLRDLFKFEFFFAEKEAFRRELAEELTAQDSGWQLRVAERSAAIHSLVRSLRPFNAHRALRPFLETYQVASETLARWDPNTPFDESVYLRNCQALGRQLLLQRRIHSGASVSKALFQTALRLAENRGLLALDADDLPGRRDAFAREIRDALRRTEAISALAASRRTGLLA